MAFKFMPIRRSAISLAIIVVIAAATTASSTSGDSVVALNEGFQQAFFWSGMVAFAGAVLALLMIRSPKQEESNGGTEKQPY